MKIKIVFKGVEIEHPSKYKNGDWAAIRTPCIGKCTRGEGIAIIHVPSRKAAMCCSRRAMKSAVDEFQTRMPRWNGKGKMSQKFRDVGGDVIAYINALFL